MLRQENLADLFLVFPSQTAVYFMIDKHSYEQVHLNVEPKSLYEFLNSGDQLYSRFDSSNSGQMHPR